jgi:pimeloyl-ACP methyl ester carboxylesterase
VVLAVHGFRGDHHGLDLLVRQLQDYTVVVPDLPGFGASGALEGLVHDSAGYGVVLEALRRELGLPPSAVLLGHSFGSVVAAHYLAAHPGAFARLVLVNPICEPALEGSQAVLSRLAAGYYALAAALPERAGLAVLRSRLVIDAMSAALGTAKDAPTRAYVKDQHRRYFGGFADRRTLQEAFGASIAGTVDQVAPAIRVPTLLVVGERDDLGSVPAQYRMAARFPDAEVDVIPGVGHLVHYESAPLAGEIIRRFLARRRP